MNLSITISESDKGACLLSTIDGKPDASYKPTNRIEELKRFACEIIDEWEASNKITQ